MYKIILKDGTIYNLKDIKINENVIEGKDDYDILAMIVRKNIKEIAFEVNVSLGNKIKKGVISISGEYVNGFTSSVQTQNVQNKVIFSLTIPNDEKKKESVININTKITFENDSTIETIEIQSDTIRGHRAKCLPIYDDLYYEALATINEVINKFDTLDSFKEKELEEMVDRILYNSSSKNENEEKEKGKNDN